MKPARPKSANWRYPKCVESIETGGAPPAPGKGTYTPPAPYRAFRVFRKSTKPDDAA
jgi:hypothetical protein